MKINKKNLLPNTSIGKLETMMKGAGHRTRLEILFFLHEKPESDLSEIKKFINSTSQNTSNHITKMVYGGLVLKQQKENFVLHKLSPRGQKFVTFLKNINQ